MQNNLFEYAISQMTERFSCFQDIRTGANKTIKMKDIALSAFAVFFTQSPSFLEAQKVMRSNKGEDNAKSLFKIERIPCDNHIRNILDEVPASEVFSLFPAVLNHPAMTKPVDDFRYLSDQLLIALDGVRSFSSNNLSCPKCSTQTHSNGETTYSHSMVSATIVHPDKADVLPLIPSFIEPQDGHEKQDCEREASKRWMLGIGAQYAQLGATLLGDDLYCCEPICKLAISQGFHFIFTCKPDSHKCLYEYVDSLEKGKGITHVEKVVGTIKGRQCWRFRYVNGVPIKDGSKALQVNWCEVEVLNLAGKRLYHNSFATDHTITNDNVYEITRAGRTRWKTENEHNNTLKNHGYHLEHNYGHGKNHLSQLLTIMILLAFLLHTALNLTDESYRAICKHFSRQCFFNQLRTLLMYVYFASWTTLMAFMLTACTPPPKRKGKK